MRVCDFSQEPYFFDRYSRRFKPSFGMSGLSSKGRHVIARARLDPASSSAFSRFFFATKHHGQITSEMIVNWCTGRASLSSCALAALVGPVEQPSTPHTAPSITSFMLISFSKFSLLGDIAMVYI